MNKRAENQLQEANYDSMLCIWQQNTSTAAKSFNAKIKTLAIISEGRE
jgi:hypothetical protein